MTMIVREGVGDDKLLIVPLSISEHPEGCTCHPCLFLRFRATAPPHLLNDDDGDDDEDSEDSGAAPSFNGARAGFGV